MLTVCLAVLAGGVAAAGLEDAAASPWVLPHPRRAPRDQPLAESFLGGASRGTSCKYAPVYGYLSADCSERKLTTIPALRTGVEVRKQHSHNSNVGVQSWSNQS